MATILRERANYNATTALIAADDNAQHGFFTLSAVAGTVLSIAIPAWARFAIISEPSARIYWRVDGDPAAPGSGSLTAGANVPATGEAPIILHVGAETIRFSSATASATFYLTFRGEQA
jgi:hypothetical protein